MEGGSSIELVVAKMGTAGNAVLSGVSKAPEQDMPMTHSYVIVLLLFTPSQCLGDCVAQLFRPSQTQAVPKSMQRNGLTGRSQHSNHDLLDVS